MKRIRIRGAAEHNLKSISVDVPRDRLTVLTGVSGSGKSSLAFDTIYKEGHRRFLESLSTYARQFLGGVERPQVEVIEGLSPAVSIEQKTVGRSPRSTVGTITEIYDHLRLLYARLGLPHCPRCGQPVRSQSPEQVVEQLLERYRGVRLLLSAPVVLDRKGEYRRELAALRRDGYRRLRIDGQPVRLGSTAEEIRLSRHQSHTIEVVYDRVEVQAEARSRLQEAVEKCFALADGKLNVVVDAGTAEDPGTPEEAEEHLFSGRFACPGCGVDLPELEPRVFSFNSPHGACPECQGLGKTRQLDPESLVADPSLPFRRGGLAVFAPDGRLRLLPRKDLPALEALARRHGFTLESSWGDLRSRARQALLHGDGDEPGVAGLLERAAAKAPDLEVEVSRELSRDLPCPACAGTRLSELPRAVTVEGRSLPDLCSLPVGELARWFAGVRLEGVEKKVGEPIVKEVGSRLRYLDEVGLSYLTLDRSARSLAGGEAQRLRLASQVGAGLQGVLFVLDEPSIGLHARDHRRLLGTLGRLRDAGNTVIVVEHDRETMEVADHVDLGPGAGTRGGEVVAEGRSQDLAREPRSLTGAYLAGRRSIDVPRRRPVGSSWLELHGVRHNNLKNVDVKIPLGLMVVVTGVSGSGKSSLVNQVLRPAVRRKLGFRGDDAGRHRSLRGARRIDKLVVIDQSPIGRTPRSNPATYTKIFERVRELYAQLPLSCARGYRASRFSFNVEGGRCLECGGSGSTVIDMQFLAPIEIVCETCGGRRYNRETLEILYQGKNIHDVLEMTVEQALECFRHHPRIVRPLTSLERVGLGYLRLGQSSTTLSGGEAQRLKLATELGRRDTGRTLYLLDEPTTGLHFEDIRVLLAALGELVDRGNSVVVIEHNLEVIKCGDYIVDLGPEGGDAGGTVVAAGTPEELGQTEESHTGAALKRELTRSRSPVPPSEPAPVAQGEKASAPLESPTAEIPEQLPVSEPGDEKPNGRAGELVVEEASEHNLKGITVRIPHQKLSVITGVSGSGKSSLAFDTIFAEGQRRYIESLSTYARQFLGRLPTPRVRRITGLAPAIAIDQKSVASSPRSTVATATEIHDHLRLLFARVGRPHCPSCGEELCSTSPSRLAGDLVRTREGERLYVLAPLELGGTERPIVEQELGQMLPLLLKSGYTRVLAGEAEIRLDEEGSTPLRRVLSALGSPEKPVADELHLVVDRVVVGPDTQSRLAGSLEQAFGRGRGVAGVKPVGGRLEFHSRSPSCPERHFSFDGQLTPRMFSFNSAEGACPRCRGRGTEERVDPDQLFTDRAQPVLDALAPALLDFLRRYRHSHLEILKALLRQRGIRHDTPWARLDTDDRRAILYGDLQGDLPGATRGDSSIERYGEPSREGRTGREGSIAVEVQLEGARFEARWAGLAELLDGWGRDGDLTLERAGLRRLFTPRVCSGCRGGRLRPELLEVRVGGLDIQELGGHSIEEAARFFRTLDLSASEATVGREIFRELENRLGFLSEVGLGYLTLDRTTSTLSGGESQRIRLASQLGNRLVGVLYVLDEPTVGLHQRDTQRLLASLRDLRDQGNTVLLVEHDRETLEAADHLIDLGPGPGARGGRVIASGTPREVAAAPDSVTGRYLRREGVSLAGKRRSPGEQRLELRGVRCHNIDGLDVSIPLGLLIAVTGVSGSGKSTLVLDVLSRLLGAHGRGEPWPSGLLEEVRGLEWVRRTVIVDQKPLGRTPRSTPATYSGAWDPIRALYASLPLARMRGYAPGRFSFNSPEGRCPACDGQGARLVEMHFLSDVWVVCDDCRGRRYDAATLEVRFKGRDIHEILEMEVDEAVDFFGNQPRILRRLRALEAVGAGYLRLGQSAATLSGGEAQRVKLAAELGERPGGGNVYLLDEPTTGLHFEDVRKLTSVLQSLVEGQNTVIVIEHQLDVVAAADWVIDLGPESANEGGRVVAEGPPEEVARVAASHTGQFLRTHLEKRDEE